MLAFVSGLNLNRHFYEDIVRPLLSSFYDRPFQVIHGEQFAQALVEQITDPEVQRIAERCLIGNVNQWSDSVDIEGLKSEKLRQLYQ